MRQRRNVNQGASSYEAHHTQDSTLKLGALLQAIFVTVLLLLITYTLYQGWNERLVERGKQAGQSELLGIRKNLFLLMGNQEMFTALYGQRIEESLFIGEVPKLADLATYLDFLKKTHPSFSFATLDREMVVLDRYPTLGPYGIGYNYQNIEQYASHIMQTLLNDSATLDGPIKDEDHRNYLVSRYALSDNRAHWGLLTLYFDFEQFLIEAGADEVSSQYQVSMNFSHEGGEETFVWGAESLASEDAVSMDLSYSLLRWNMKLAPKDSWVAFSLPLLLYGIVSTLVCLAIGVLIYLHQIRYELVKARSRTDSLTGLLNRREFLNLLSQTDSGEQSYAVALIDIDNFKEINDTYGHLNGDKALLSLVETLKHHIRMSDVIARFGGDEFILLFRDCSNIDFCKRLFQAIRHTNVELEGKQVEVVISMGIAFSADEEKSPQALIATADRRLYQAKLGGKGRLCSFG